MKGKSKGKRQKAKIKSERGARQPAQAVRLGALLPFAFCLLPFDFPL
jgi:hypothetical protein